MGPTTRNNPNETRLLISHFRLLHSGRKEGRSIPGIRAISQMGCSDNQCPITNFVARCTVNFGLVLRVSRDLATVLLVASESEENHPLDLIMDFCGDLLERTIDNSTSLAIIKS